MSVKIEANAADTTKESEVGDLFTDPTTGCTFQIRELPSGWVSMSSLTGYRWGEAFAAVADLKQSCLASLIPFKPGESVTLTQE